MGMQPHLKGILNDLQEKLKKIILNLVEYKLNPEITKLNLVIPKKDHIQI